MFLDEVIIASLIVVGGCVLFVGGIWAFIYADAHNKNDKAH